MNLWPWSRIRALEQENTQLRTDLVMQTADYNKHVTHLRRQVDALIRDIRGTDDIILSISQSADGTWKTVQARFATLCDQMTVRKVAESNRINTLIDGELRNTYAPNPTQALESHR